LEDFARGISAQPVEIALAAGESTLLWLVLPRLAKIRKQLPGVSWILQKLKTEEILERLADGRSDIGIVRSDALPKSLTGTPIGNLEFALFIPARRRAANVTDDFNAVVER